MDNHISISCATEMKEIAFPLFNLGITYFEHVKLYNQGFLTWLSTDDDRAKSLLAKETSGALNFDFDQIRLQRYLFAEDIVNTIKNPQMKSIAVDKLIDSRENFDIRNLFQIVSIKNGIYEAFVFGTNEKNNLQKSNYINLISFLENFIYYFYEKAEELIFQAEKEAIQLPGLKVRTNDSIYSTPKAPQATRYHLNSNNKNEYLTLKEYQICYFLHRGYSRKEIATLLNTKIKTVDGLILNAIERNSTYNLRHLLNKIKLSDLKYSLYSNFMEDKG